MRHWPSMNGLPVVVLVGLGTVGAPGLGAVALAQAPTGHAQVAKLGEEWTKNNPPGRTTAQERPAVKDNLCPQIPVEEREAIGLPAPTWVATHGKVQPAVHDALERQKKLIESGDPLLEFQGDRPCGFQGTVFVDVYLRHDRGAK